MTKKLFSILTLFIFLYTNLVSAQSVGLVLSGGGAKGIAHVGVIKALEENGIPIDYITGTSMGSIIGGLYATGYTSEEMMELLLSPKFAHWSTGQIEDNYKFYFNKQNPSPEFFNLNFNLKDSAAVSMDFLPKSLINPIPMNFAFMELFAPFTAQCGGNFNNLFVPFRCIGSDVYNKREVVFSSGDLGDAIRASMSFPLVFKPIKINGATMVDGGVYNNFPVDVMKKDFAPSFILGVDIVSKGDSIDDANIVKLIETMVIQPQSDSVNKKDGIKLELDLSDYGLLDFPKAKAIYQVGYDNTIKIIDSIRARVNRRVLPESIRMKRKIFRSNTPELRFKDISVHGGSIDQNDYVRYVFDRENDKNDKYLSLNDTKDAYYKTISTGKVSDLIPRAKYNKATNLFNLDMNLTPKNNIGIGAGGYLTSSTNSMLFLSAKYSTLSLNSFTGSISAWIGQTYHAGELNARIALRTPFASEFVLQGVMSKNKFYESNMLFFEDDNPTFILNYENYIRLKYDIAVGRRHKFEIGVGYGYLRDKFYPTTVQDYLATKQDEAKYKLGQLYAKIGSNYLNYVNYPTRGYSYSVTAMGILGQYRYMPQGCKIDKSKDCSWIKVELEGSKYWNFGKHFALGVKGNIVASTKKLLEGHNANVIQAPAFTPTPATENSFNPAFRANSYAAAGILPIALITPNLQVRSEFYAFVPARKIKEVTPDNSEYGDWFGNPQFMGELSVVYNFPFAALSVYGNYLSYPKKNWNFGVSFGIFLPAQKFLK